MAKQRHSRCSEHRCRQWTWAWTITWTWAAAIWTWAAATWTWWTRWVDIRCHLVVHIIAAPCTEVDLAIGLPITMPRIEWAHETYLNYVAFECDSLCSIIIEPQNMNQIYEINLFLTNTYTFLFLFLQSSCIAFQLDSTVCIVEKNHFPTPTSTTIITRLRKYTSHLYIYINIWYKKC